MKKVLLLLIPLCAIQVGWSQVGINNTNPQSTLDITASNVASPANTDGILIPRIDDFPATDPGTAQDGMMIFATGNGTPDKGFYFWDDTATNWISIAGISGPIAIDDLTDGKSDIDGSDDGSSIFFGINAGSNDDSSDNRNVGIGYNSMNSNIGGNNNVAIGHRSLTNNTDGNNNVSLGQDAMRSNSSGNSNTAIGALSLESNTTGGVNVAIGVNALNANTSGGANTAVGGASMLLNVSGVENAVLGGYSMNANVDGDNNTVAGFRAFTGSTSGGNNTILGHRAMNSSSQGDFNVAVGKSAGYHAGGNQNTFLGSNSGGDVGTNALSGSVFVGYRSGFSETTSNRLYIENSSANSNNALIYGEFDNDILRTNGELQIGNPTGTGYALPTTDGNVDEVLTTNGSGTISWAAPTITEIDGDITNEIQDLSVTGTDLNISGGGTGTSMMAFINPSFPDGMQGMVGVTHTFSSNYNVPAGKNLYITNIHSANTTAEISINGRRIHYGRENRLAFQSLTQPLIAGAGEVINSTDSSVLFNGFLADAKVTPITSFSIVVPANRMLVVLNVKRSVAIGSVLSRINGAVVYFGDGSSSGTAGQNSFFNPLFVDSGQTFTSGGVFNGYLITK